MSLTVNLKQSGFQPIGAGRLLYQFTESSLTGKTNYRIEIEFNGLSIPVVSYWPDSLGVVEADIAPLLRTVLALDFDPTLRFLNTYVKYQAVWEESSDAQVNLSGDVIYFYPGYNNRLNNRVQFEIDDTDGQFLVPTSKLYIFEGYTAYLEFLSNITNTPNPKHLIVEGNTGVPSLFLDYQLTTGKRLNSYSFIPANYSQARILTFAGTAFSTVNTSGWTLDTAYMYSQRFVAVTGLRYFKVGLKKTGSPSYTSVTFKIVANNAGSPDLSDVKATITLTDFTTIEDSLLFLDFGSFTFVNGTTYHLVISSVSVTVDGSNKLEIFTSAASTYGSGTFLSYFGGVWTDETVDLYGSYFTGATELSVLPIEYSPACNNPVYLKWLNDLGGISSWLFDRDQLYSFDPQPFGRFTRKRVVAGPIRTDQWVAFQELLKAGEELDDNKTFGKLIVDATDESNEINVIVEPEASSIRTKNPRGFLGLTLRYPQLDNMGL